MFGVSRDNMKSHDDFKAKLELPFELIADTEEKMCHMFGVVKNNICTARRSRASNAAPSSSARTACSSRNGGLEVPGYVDEVLKAVKLLKKAA